MGEVGVSWRIEGSSEVGDLEMADCEESLKMEEMEKKEEESCGVVRWEEYMPRMVIRVLLVEADDSTRQIIAALLRKCNYKVAAIPDGLKAWEILKRKHNNIDLILTEVDLPSISGYALLTLIMEHDSCKNIPVIMMSSSDSISTVFKCMLKGAADFLIKPVRRNELKNLWQHVWRRISANNGSGAQSLQGDHRRAEVTSKNKATRNCSDDDVSSSRKRSRSMEKASDAQSSCPTRCLDAENAYLENTRDLSQTKHHGNSHLSNEARQHEKEMRLEEQPEEEKSTRLESSGTAQDNRACASAFRLERVGSCSGRTAQKVRSEPASCGKMDALPSGELSKHGRQAIDLIGTIDNHLERDLQQSTSNHQMHNSGANPRLELSLRRSNDPNDQRNDEKQKLNHSNSSAFSRYSSNRKLQTLLPLSSNCPSEVVNGGEKFTQKSVALSSDEENKSTVMTDPTFPASRVAFTGMCPGYGPMYPSQAPAGPKPTNPNEPPPFFPSTPLHSEPGAHGSSLGHSGFDETSNHEEKLAPEDQLKCVNGAASQSANSTLCSNSFMPQGSENAKRGAREDNAEEDHVREVSEQVGRTKGIHSSQREAALAKFRQKRKDRCFEKKVRYQSRKRLAEQRPRVKGQFVRQAQTDQPNADTEIRHEDDGG